MQRVILIDGNFEEFKRRYKYNAFNFPIEGNEYCVRGNNGNGGITLYGVNNPLFPISKDPYLFEELHFNKDRFVFLSDNEPTPIMFHIYAN